MSGNGGRNAGRDADRGTGRGTGRSAGRRGRRVLAGSAVVAAAVVAVLAGGVWVVQGRLDQDALRLRAEARFERATGRQLRIETLRVTLLPVPELLATNVAVADMPGGARPAMLHADRVTAKLDPVALFRHVLRLQGLTLVHPELILERNAAGRANWRFEPPARPGTGGGGGGGTREPWRVEVGSLRMERAALDWADARGGRTGAVTLDTASGSGLDGSAPRMFAQGSKNGVRFAVEAGSGALRRLWDATGAGTTPWPVRVDVRLRNGTGVSLGQVSVDGTLRDPERGRGYELAVKGELPRLDALDALFPHAELPAVAGVVLDAAVADAAAAADAGTGNGTGTAGDAVGGQPVLRRLALRTGAFDPASVLRRRALAPLAVDALTVRADAPDAPLTVTASGRWRGEAASLDGRAGTLAGWQEAVQPETNGTGTAAAGKGGPVSLRAAVGRARLAADGTAARNRASLAVTVDAPDWRALAARGPELTALQARATVDWTAERLALDDIRLASRELALTGTAALERAGTGRPELSATLAVDHADADALLAGIRDADRRGGNGRAEATAAAGARPVAVAGRSGAEGAGSGGAGNGAGAGAAGQAGGERPVGGGGNGPAVPGTIAAPGGGPSVPTEAEADEAGGALPFEALERLDAIVALRANTVRFGGQEYRSLDAGAVLRNGHLAVDRFRVDGPGGRTEARGTADAETHAVELALRPATVPAGWLLRWLVRDPAALDGSVELVAELQGRGRTRAEMERSLSGTAGASLVDGRVDGAALGRLLASPVAVRGTTAVRCLALAARVGDGRAELFSMALDTERLSATGHGTVALDSGALDLHLSPHLAVGGVGASLPVRVGGTLDAPDAVPDRAGPDGRVVLQIGPGSGSGGAAPDPCGAGLAAARFGVPGPMPAAAAPKRRGGKAIDFLRGLFGGHGG